jgi:ribosomal protein L20A (L18A)
MPKLLREGPEVKLTLLQYLCSIEDWFNERGVPHWKQGAWTDFEDSIRSFWLKLDGRPPPTLTGRIRHWHVTYGTPENVAGGQFHHDPKPRGLGLEWHPSKEELLKAWQQWILDWIGRTESQGILDEVQRHKYNSFGEEQKPRIIGRIFGRAPSEPKDKEWRTQGPGPSKPSTLRSYCGDKSYEFIRAFVQEAKAELWILTYSVEARALRLLLEGSTRRLRRVVIAAQKFDNIDEVRETVRITAGVENPELATCSKLHAKLILRDPGEDGAVVVGSANLTLSAIGSDRGSGSYEVCVRSNAPDVVRCSRELFDVAKGLSHQTRAGAGPERLLHSFSGGNLLGTILAAVEASPLSVIYTPRFISDWVYGPLIETACEAQERSGQGRRLCIRIAWPKAAGARLRPMLLELKKLQTDGVLDLGYLARNFHGKVYFFSGKGQARTVVVASANLTRGSWLESIECGLFSEDAQLIEELEAGLRRVPASPGNDPDPAIPGPHPPGPNHHGEGKQWLPTATLEGQDLADNLTMLFAAFRHRVPNELISTLASEEEDTSVSGEDLDLLGISEDTEALSPTGGPLPWVARGEFYDRRDHWQRFQMACEAPTVAAARERILSSIGGCHGVKRALIRLFDVVPAPDEQTVRK